MSGSGGEMTVGVAVLPSGRAELLGETLDSILAQGVRLEDVAVVDREEVSGAVPQVRRARCVAEVRGDALAFARAGDRFLPGKLERQLAALRDRPDAGLCFGGYRRRSEQDEALSEWRPSPEEPSVAELLAGAPALETSAVVIRRDAVRDDRLLDLVRTPGGDAVLWATIAEHRALVRIGEPLAEVLLDPRRHGLDPEARFERLLTIVSAPVCLRCGAAPALRRALLAGLYLERDAPARAGLPAVSHPGIDLWELAPREDPDALADFVRDLQWTLERQVEALAAERTSWPQGIVDPELPVEDPVVRAAELEEQMRWLHTEVAKRDRLVEELRAQLARQRPTEDPT